MTMFPDYHDSDGGGPETYELVFDYARPPLTANQRLHWRERADRTSGIRTSARFLARRIPYLGRCEVSLVWVVTDRRRRDADNIVPTMKAMCDGLVDAGVVSDDTPDLMVKRMPEIRMGSKAHLVLTVTPLPKVAA